VTPNVVTDFVGICVPRPELADRYAALLPSDDGWRLAAPHVAWAVSTRSMGAGTVPDGDPIVLEGWPDLCRWKGTPRDGRAALARCVERGRYAEVPGDVGWVYIRPDGSAVAARAPAGRVPLYAHRFDDGVILSTRMDHLLCLRPEWPWRLDGLVLHNWGGYKGVPPRGRTTIEEVTSIPGGHVVTVTAPSMPLSAPSRFWDPRPYRIPRRSNPRDYGERLRTMVLDYLRDELDPGGTNLLSLSAGVDSSTLAVAARRLLGREYSAVSMLPLNRIDRNLEEHYLRVVADVAPPRQHIRYAWTPEEDLRVFEEGPPVGVPVIHPVLLKLQEIRSRIACSVYFGGEWADASCGARVTLPDWLAHAPFRDLLRYQARLAVGEKAVVRAVARRLARRRPLPEQSALPDGVPESAAPAVREEFEEWAEARDREFREDPRPLARLAQELETDYWLLQNWEVCSALGVRRLTPFFHRGIVELVFGASPTALLGPRTKQPLRRAFREDVPPAVLFRKKGVWANEPAPGEALWPQDLPEELSTVVREDWFPRPPAALPFRERLALAAYSGYAMQLRVLRARAARTETEVHGRRPQASNG
jgi:asparagine synthetase B (glutamine-hydrolysing)